MKAKAAKSIWIMSFELDRIEELCNDRGWSHYPGILQLNKPIMRYRPNKACFFNVKFFVLYYSILWYFL